MTEKVVGLACRTVEPLVQLGERGAWLSFSAKRRWRQMTVGNCYLRIVVEFYVYAY
mgnify:CR=1 FL=1